VWRAGGARINIAQKIGLWLVTRFLRPSLLLCTAEAVRKTFAPLVPAPSAVVRNGVDTEFFRCDAGVAARHRPPGARWVIGCAVRLTRAKRPDDFIALASRLRSRYPDARFLLAGSGSRRAVLEAAARRLGADNLEFLGFVGDMRSFYAACDIVVLPSGAEGCPNVVLEAMAMGKPVVAADVRPVLELLGTSGSAFVYRLGNVDELADRVQRLLERPDLRSEIALRGYLHALGMTARANAAELDDLMRSLIATEATASPEPREARRQPAVVPALPSLQPGQRDSAAPRIPLPDPRGTG
jgi:glycosyltransferase involved in cell wall biosynthesis